jgi:hypothetical protein
MLALSASPALASTSPNSVSYGCTDSDQTMTVPTGANTATINMAGAAGQGSGDGVLGGAGDTMVVTVPVSGGQTIRLEVGCQDGFGGGGDANQQSSAGNGGGATSVWLSGTEVAVAGAGGGAGGQEDLPISTPAGGAGGNADQAGAAGGFDPRDQASYAGQGGQGADNGAAGGLGGDSPYGTGVGSPGDAGTSGQGGSGGVAATGDGLGIAGGGGGGGYVGGGGGGGGSLAFSWDGGGGGGGGSSYIDTAAGVTQSSESVGSAGDGSATITYSFNAPVQLSSDSVSFGHVSSLGGSSATQTVTVSDIGTGAGDGPVTFGQVAVSGNASSLFSIVSDQCSGVTLTDGQSCTMQVQYTPAAGSSSHDTAALQFPSDSVSGNMAVQLHGVAFVPADMQVLPGSLGFGSVATGATVTQTVAVSNTGETTLDVTGANISGSGASEFSLVSQQNLCPAQLAPGASCTMQVQLAPSYLGAASATLTLNSDNASTKPTVDVALSGTGVTPAPLPVGPQGPQGATGATGPQGATGAKGAVTLTYTMARAGKLRLTMQRKSGRSWSVLGTRTLHSAAGRHSLTLGTKFAGRKLHAGTYRLLVQGHTGKTRSKTMKVTFSVSAAGAVTIH